MVALRVLLVGLWAGLAIYTVIATARHGLVLVQVFFGDLAALTWPGQFNLDFMTFLILSALWVAWRHSFSALGLVLAAVALVGGGLFTCAYLLVISLMCQGDMRTMLLGPTRSAR